VAAPLRLLCCVADATVALPAASLRTPKRRGPGNQCRARAVLEEMEVDTLPMEADRSNG
jgi:hypothetical protein